MRIAQFILISIILVYAIPPDKCRAEIDASSLISTFGGEIEIKTNPCRIFLDIDSEKALRSIPVAQRLGILGKEIPVDQLKRMPFSVINAISIALVYPLLYKTYKGDATLDKCSFGHGVDYKQEGARTQYMTLYFYTMTRKQFEQTDWGSVSFKNTLDKVNDFQGDHIFPNKVER